MPKLKPALSVLLICVSCFLISVISSYASEESLTITTYYPSPYGSYNQLQTNSLGVGDVNGDGTLNSSDVPPTTTPPYGDLWIAGNITVGGVAYAHVPRGALMFFNLPACPSGWTELTNARGRVILGLPSGGGLGAMQGTALSVANPTRTITSVPAHAHSLSTVVDGSVGGGPYMVTAGGNGAIGPSVSTDSAGSASIDVTMPYMQFLVCVKN